MAVREIDPAETGEVHPVAHTMDEKQPVEKTVFDSTDEIIESAGKIYVPGEEEEFVDLRLRDYPILLVAKTVDLHNDFSEPILTFRFFVLSTFWVLVGDAISTMYYFKPYSNTLTSYAVQLLSWGMGDFLGRVLPKRSFHIFGRSFSLNPGPWNAKEHALIVVAYWGSVSAACPSRCSCC